MPDEDSVETKKHNVRVVIASLGNERRTIPFGEMDEDRVQEIIQTVNNSFGTVRQSSALLLTGSDGVIIFANLDNVAFVEVHVG